MVGVIKKSQKITDIVYGWSFSENSKNVQIIYSYIDSGLLGVLFEGSEMSTEREIDFTITIGTPGY